jgi:GTP-binding protein
MKKINRQKVHFIKGLGNIEQTERWIESETEQLPGICFIGRSNVGKSSLINALFGNKIAKVSQTPGKTREINLFRAEILDPETDESKSFWLIDLPGYGYAKASKEIIKKWQNLMNFFFEKSPRSLMMVSMRDSRHPNQESDELFMDYLKDYKRNFVIAFNKFDKLKTQKDRTKLKKFTDELKSSNPQPMFKVSAERRDNLQDIENFITDYIWKF